MKKTALILSLLIAGATQARHYHHTYGQTYEVITYEPCVTFIPTCVPQPVIVEYYEPDIISSTFNLVGSILDCATESQRARRERKAAQKEQIVQQKPEPKVPELQKTAPEKTDAELAKVKAELEATRKELKELKSAVK